MSTIRQSQYPSLRNALKKLIGMLKQPEMRTKEQFKLNDWFIIHSISFSSPSDPPTSSSSSSESSPISFSFSCYRFYLLASISSTFLSYAINSLSSALLWISLNSFIFVYLNPLLPSHSSHGPSLLLTTTNYSLPVSTELLAHSYPLTPSLT